LYFLFFSCYPVPRDLPSFPTRRSSDLGLPDMPGWVLSVLGVTLALTFMAGAGLPGAWNGFRHYQDGKARLTTNDYIGCAAEMERDRKSTRLNSSHLGISYAVFCLKKKK